MDKNTLVQIILVIAVIYLFFRKPAVEKEGMADFAQVDLDSIKTLADVAKRLQTGGYTVAGDINLPKGANLNLGSDQTKDGAAGRIAYGVYEPGLNIVGGSNNNTNDSNTRAIVMWAEGGGHKLYGNSTISSSLNVGANATIGGTTSFGNNVGLSNKQLRLRDIGDGAHYMAYATDVDGVEIKGFAGGKLTTHDGTATPFKWTKTGVEVAGNSTMNGNVALNGTIRTGGLGFRLINVNIGDNAKQDLGLSANNWVCTLAGIRMDFGGTAPGAINAFCYVGPNGNWFIRSEAEYIGDSGRHVVLAIPKSYFESVENPPNSEAYIGGW